MTRSQAVARIGKPLVWTIGLMPVVWIVYGLVTNALGAEPVREIQHITGLSALVSLLLSLAVSPIRRMLEFGELIRLRRPIGLFAFFHASLHLATYAVFDQSLDPRLIIEDIVEHPWVLAGFAGWLIMVPLAVTSTTGMIRRLGGARWRLLHRGAYLAALAGALHFLWLVKKDVTEPYIYLAVLGVLLVARVPFRRNAASPTSAAERSTRR